MYSRACVFFPPATLATTLHPDRLPGQAVGLAWFAVSWAACYRLQPCKALGSHFFKHRTEQFFEAAQR